MYIYIFSAKRKTLEIYGFTLVLWTRDRESDDANGKLSSLYLCFGIYNMCIYEMKCGSHFSFMNFSALHKQTLQFSLLCLIIIYS